MTQDIVDGNEETAVEQHAAFILDAYLAAFDRVASAQEVTECASRLGVSQSHAAFLSSLMQSEERQLVLERRRVGEERQRTARDDDECFIATVYRVLFDREPDAPGLQAHLDLLAQGMRHSDLLDGLAASEEAKSVRASSAPPHLLRDPEDLVRTIFEAVLHRPPEPSAVAFYAQEVRERMDIVGFTRGLADSPEGRGLRGRQSSGGLNASCANLTLFLESLLRQRGMRVDQGPVPASDMPVAQAERLLTRLARAIEMLSSHPQAS